MTLRFWQLLSIIAWLTAGILIGRMTDQHPLFATISGPVGSVSSFDEI